LTKHIDVVGAVIIREGEILCAQRGPDSSLPGMWEFPGGKIEAGESARDALQREIVEELRCRVRVGEKVTETSHEYEFGVVALTTFYCELIEGSPMLSEHAAVTWLLPADLGTLDWAPADIPAVEIIQRDHGPK
jgi:8-oxo-dGTP diphosphatase